MTLPNTIEQIYSYAFADNYLLESINIPSSVKKISRYAFYYSRGLKNLVLDIGELEIYNGAFSGCNSLDKVFVLNGDIAEITWTKGFVDAPFNNPFYYSENEPTDEGNYWHYVDDVPTVWEID